MASASTEQTAEQAPFSRIAIAGLGLIGASLAAALRQAYPGIRLFGADIDERTCEIAVAKGWVDGATAPDAPAFRDFVLQADLAVVATPVDASESILRLLAEWGFEGVITDTASTKAHLAQVASEILPHPHNYVPGHPMAGSEVNGIEGARPDLFKGAYWILCPDASTPPEHFTRLHELVTGMGARVIALKREDHDQSVAIVSHVPHFMASSLMQLASRHADKDRSLMRLAAGGFKDITRIASSSPQMWQDICLANSESIDYFLSHFEKQIEDFRHMIAEKDGASIQDEFHTAGDYRDSIPAKKSSVIARSYDLFINIDDRAGAIATIATILSVNGISIKNIGIIHNREYVDGVMKLELYKEDDEKKARELLIQNRYDIVDRD